MTEDEATYPSFLLSNPTVATDYQRELMVGISAAEHRGCHTTRDALVHLLRASLRPGRANGGSMRITPYDALCVEEKRRHGS